MRESVDVIVLGAGFAGSLLAMMLHRRGFRVALLERGSHPRFSLGESSTPLANLALEEIARDYDLPWLADLTEYAHWKKNYPELVCGLKRGFTFIRHLPGCHHPASPDHADELLVAASPNDDVSDTQWLRADFDAFLVRQAVALGVLYLDRLDLSLHPLTDQFAPQSWRIEGRREGESVELFASFLVDATGPAGALAHRLQIATSPVGIHTASWAIFNHFEGVEPWESIARALGVPTDEYPYHCDDAALHHILDGAWMWLLRFDNGVTSAGILVDGTRRLSDSRLTPEQEWNAILSDYPDIQRQFAQARSLRPWERTGRLQRRARQVVGPTWAMLGPAAYSLDALYSSGNAHALATVQRLARLLERHWKSALDPALAAYQASLFREIEFLDWIVDGTYRAFRHFRLLTTFAMYYFAGAITSEERRRRGESSPEDEFLHSHDPAFRLAVRQGWCRVHELATEQSPDVMAFFRETADAIRPWNRTGLCDLSRRNLYPFD